MHLSLACGEHLIFKFPPPLSSCTGHWRSRVITLRSRIIFASIIYRSGDFSRYFHLFSWWWCARRSLPVDDIIAYFVADYWRLTMLSLNSAEHADDMFTGAYISADLFSLRGTALSIGSSIFTFKWWAAVWALIKRSSQNEMSYHSLLTAHFPETMKSMASYRLCFAAWFHFLIFPQFLQNNHASIFYFTINVKYRHVISGPSSSSNRDDEMHCRDSPVAWRGHLEKPPALLMLKMTDATACEMRRIADYCTRRA